MFVSAYVARKLKEADALTLDVTESMWPVSRCRCIKSPPHRKWFAVSYDEGKTWRQPLEDHYDLTGRNREQLRFAKICDYLVHHFAFEVRYDEGVGIIELLFNSDRTKDRLYVMDLRTYVGLVEEVAYDEVRWVDLNQAEGRVVQRRQRPRDE